MSETPTDAIETMMEPAPEAPFWTKLEGLPSMMKALAKARAKTAHDEMLVRVTQSMIEATDAYAAWQKATSILSASKEQVAAFDAAVRKAALEDFKANGEKAVYIGISIKLFTKVEYDPKAMRDWAKLNMPSLLMLDVKGTDVAAKAGLLEDAPVFVSKEPRVIIASDLSAYLAEAKP